MVALKTLDPPLERARGQDGRGRAPRRQDAGRRVLGGDEELLELLVHLMSAGRLQVFDKRASLKDRASRMLIRLADGRELRLREFGTKQRAWAKLLPPRRGRGRRDGRDARAGGLAGAAARGARRGASTSRATSTPCSATSARSPASAAPGSTRSSGRRSWRRFGRAPSSTPSEVERLHAALARARRRDRPLRGGGRRRRSRTSCRCRCRCTAARASPARDAGRRSRPSTSPSTRPTTARTCQTGGRVLKDRRLSRLLK